MSAACTSWAQVRERTACSLRQDPPSHYFDASQVVTMASHQTGGSKAVIKNADMTEEMQSDAIDCATQVRLRVNLNEYAPCVCLCGGDCASSVSRRGRGQGAFAMPYCGEMCVLMQGSQLERARLTCETLGRG
eukprot:354266-Chlamydomonas_euryale.AAC.21